MSLKYNVQQPSIIFGSKSGTTRTSTTLTDTYVAGNVINVEGMTKVNYDILYTMGASETTNSIEVKIECSSDGTNFYRIPNDSTSAGTSTMTAREFTFVGSNAAAATISISLDVFYVYLKFSIKETGVVTNYGTAFVESTISG